MFTSVFCAGHGVQCFICIALFSLHKLQSNSSYSCVVIEEMETQWLGILTKLVGP